MAFIEPMHRNKPNITYLLTPALEESSIIPSILPNASLTKLSWMQLLISLLFFIINILIGQRYQPSVNPE